MVKFDYDRMSGVYFAECEDYNILYAWCGLNGYDLSGWSIHYADTYNGYSSDDEDIANSRWWDDKKREYFSDEYIADSITRFEKLIKKYTPKYAKEIIAKFHKDIGF